MMGRPEAELSCRHAFVTTFSSQIRQICFIKNRSFCNLTSPYTIPTLPSVRLTIDCIIVLYRDFLTRPHHKRDKRICTWRCRRIKIRCVRVWPTRDFVCITLEKWLLGDMVSRPVPDISTTHSKNTKKYRSCRIDLNVYVNEIWWVNMEYLWCNTS